jgi:hypothetical protein
MRPGHTAAFVWRNRAPKARIPPAGATPRGHHLSIIQSIDRAPAVHASST